MSWKTLEISFCVMFHDLCQSWIMLSELFILLRDDYLGSVFIYIVILTSCAVKGTVQHLGICTCVFISFSNVYK